MTDEQIQETSGLISNLLNVGDANPLNGGIWAAHDAVETFCRWGYFSAIEIFELYDDGDYLGISRLACGSHDFNGGVEYDKTDPDFDADKYEKAIEIMHAIMLCESGYRDPDDSWDNYDSHHTIILSEHKDSINGSTYCDPDDESAIWDHIDKYLSNLL